MFVAFEDDMRITGSQVQHFLDMSHELETLQKQAPEELPDVPEDFKDPQKSKFFGQMTMGIRVEVLVNETKHGAQKELDPIELDFQFPGSSEKEDHFDPSVCCHIENVKRTPKLPDPEDVIIWETSVKALGLRQISGSTLLDWLVLLMGPGKRIEESELTGSYWSGRDGAFGSDKRPSGGSPDLVAQQGGWMATRAQIIRLDEELCQGKFLPPFDEPIYYEDGQQSMNVEYWSGGYQLFTGIRGGCNMQRVMSFKPEHYSKHFIYHVANNKQKQLKSERMLRVDHLYGQLITVLKKAKETMQRLKAD
eukprot:CAMPEP_0116825388 /NCGR_PEP_ID=MMETSP0418-20121206/1936_1 /TAXON_ID=1158023 /ORGANISM="Astrosyne radiata, Strain 13vi08-1A" /LENGTH=306 /DNA_ID=CAMNT_0004453887 /DNA_START=42 /DNA_END=962 /DNA_ORIENTATION=-